jgi:hypothetical protein
MSAPLGPPPTGPFVDGELIALPSDFSSLDQFLVNDLLRSGGLEPSPVPLIWHAVGAQEGFLVSWCKAEGDELNRYRATAELPIDIERMQILLKDINNLKAIQPNLVNIELLKQIDPNHQIVRMELKLPSVLTNRELVVLISYNKLTSGPHSGAFIVCFNSINIARYTTLLNPSNVRAKLIRSGYILEPTSSGGVRFTNIFEADLAGWLPIGLQNFVAVHGIQAAISSMADKKEEKNKEEIEKEKQSHPDYSGLSSKLVQPEAGGTGKPEPPIHGSVGGSTGEYREEMATGRSQMARPK